MVYKLVVILPYKSVFKSEFYLRIVLFDIRAATISSMRCNLSNVGSNGLRLCGHHLNPSYHKWVSFKYSGGISQIEETLHRVRTTFYWKGIRNQIWKFIQECDICQCQKTELTQPAGLLSPLPIPRHIWTDINGLYWRPSNFKGEIDHFVVVDRQSKYEHFIPLGHPYTISMVAQVFFKGIFKLHGMPKSIVCDRDHAFTSLFSKSLFQ